MKPRSSSSSASVVRILFLASLRKVSPLVLSYANESVVLVSAEVARQVSLSEDTEPARPDVSQHHVVGLMLSGP